jgi:antitoxin component of RelBE/YafQ-DinJ toxin-antitoxin module
MQKQQQLSRLDIRVTPDKKQEIKEIAKKLGLTMTELILTRLNDLPLKDYNKENEFLKVANELTQELGYIGNNINQVTIAIHQMKNSQKINQGEIIEFNKLMGLYNTKRNELSEKLSKIFFK